MNSIRLRRGFTLIELLVVIAIIGILAALIIVSLTGARARATDTQLKNKARNLATAAEQYAVDNSNKYYGNTTSVQQIATGGTVATAYAAYVSGGSTSQVFDKGSSPAYQYSGTLSLNCGAVGTSGSTAEKYAAGIALTSTSETANVQMGIYDTSSGSITVNSCVITGMGTNTKAFAVYGPQ